LALGNHEGREAMRTGFALCLFAAAAGVAACSTYYDDGRHNYGRYAYDGRDYDRLGNGCGFFAGRGGELLDPWLACTREGQELVRYRFDGDRDRRVKARTADRANIWFRRHADTNRDLRLTDPEIRAALVNSSRHLARR
jgi:hypothetical protein